jgi:hypothetical protein
MTPPDLPEKGTIIRLHTEVKGDGDITYPPGELFVFIKQQPNTHCDHGYYMIIVEHFKTGEMLYTYDDYFKENLVQSKEMDAVKRCIFET